MSMTEFVFNLERELIQRRSRKTSYTAIRNLKTFMSDFLIGVYTMTSFDELNANLHKWNGIKRTLGQRRENAMFTLEVLFYLWPSYCASFVDLNIRKQRKWHGTNINQQIPFWLQNRIGSVHILVQHRRSSLGSGSLWLLSSRPHKLCDRDNIATVLLYIMKMVYS
jgi:hypothetical protein